MAHYDIFRHNLAIKYPAYGHALWEPSPGDSYPAVEIGDVGFIREGRFHRLFNVLLPADHPSHENYGVPEYYEQLTLHMRNHIIPGTLSPNNLYSARVSSEPVPKILASGPDGPQEVVFSCKRKQGAVLSFPVQAKCQNTVALGDFGEWMIEHIDSWFDWVRQLGVGVGRMEDIILVTGTHRTRSWTNVAFPGGQEDAQVLFGPNVTTRGGIVSIDWKISQEWNRGGAMLNCGPIGENLPEDQCIFIRGFRVTRKLMILPRELKAAAGPNPDPDPTGDDSESEPDVELQSIPTVPEYRDPLHILLEYVAESAPNCDMALVHDDDLTQICGLGDDTLLEALKQDTLLRHLQRLKPQVYDVLLGPDSSSGRSSPNVDAETSKVATLSTIFEGHRGANAEAMRSAHDIDKQVGRVNVRAQRVKNVKSVEKDTQMIINEAREAKSIIQQTGHNVLRESLRKWQSPPDPSINHNIASCIQCEGTAEWFRKSNMFEEWKASGSLLWICGKPGSGKSILCSAIINDIATSHKAGLASMAYFYFDFRDNDKRSRRGLLSSLLIQLIARSDPRCDILSRLYKEHDYGTRQPSDDALMCCLEEMLTLPDQGPVYIILDALDECPNTSGVLSSREQVLKLVEELVGLRLRSLHLCATSRPEVDIRLTLASLASHSVSLHDESGHSKDIAKYLRSVVFSDSVGAMRRWRDVDKALVIKTLSEADGMFRWVFCQLETLRQCLPQNIPRVLSQLPETLDETYERVLKGIGTANRHHAYRLLQCLAVSIRPLIVEELAEILALDFDNTKDGLPRLEEDWRWEDQEEAVLTTCSSLIRVVGDGSQRVVQFSHFSVKEFLTSDRLAASSAAVSHFYVPPEQAHTVLAKISLGILLQLDDDVGDIKTKRIPFNNYAAEHWTDHAQFEEVSTHVEDGIRRLFDPAKPYFGRWVWLCDIDKGWKTFLGRRDTGRGSPLYYASMCGFHDLAARLIDENTGQINAQCGRYLSPLVAALHKRHFDIAELLYQHGGDVGITGYGNRTLLHAASVDGSIDIAEWLLAHGVDATSQQDDGDTPLHLAARHGQLEFVRMLIRHSTIVDGRNEENRTQLHLTSELGHVARLLSQHGADIAAQDPSHSTPLHLASPIRSLQSAGMLRLLLEDAADVDARDGRRTTPSSSTVAGAGGFPSSTRPSPGLSEIAELPLCEEGRIEN